jgi:hypothetical protein
LHDGDVRACVVPSHLAMSHNMMDEKSEPVAQAYLDALALCEKEGVTTLWVHDSLGLFPSHDRSGNCDEPARPDRRVTRPRPCRHLRRARPYRFLEFFTAQIRNPHTRRAYALAATEFFDWLAAQGSLSHEPFLLVCTYHLARAGFNRVNWLANQSRRAREPLLARCDNACSLATAHPKRQQTTGAVTMPREGLAERRLETVLVARTTSWPRTTRVPE